MNEEFLKKYPEAKTSMELLRDQRLEKLKAWLRKHDEEYRGLRHASAEQGSALMKFLYDIDKGDAYNKYEDAFHEASFYEKDFIYAQGFYDAWAYLKGLSFPPEDEV